MPGIRTVARLLLAVVVISVTSHAFSRPPQAKPAANAKGADLAWMTGDWTDSTRGWTQETWSKPLSGAMHGMCRIGEDPQHATYEILLLEDESDGVVLRIRHFGAKLAAREEKPITFRLIASGENEATFETHEKGRTTRLIYRLESKDSMQARLEKDRDGKRSATDFHYARAK